MKTATTLLFARRQLCVFSDINNVCGDLFYGSVEKRRSKRATSTSVFINVHRILNSEAVCPSGATKMKLNKREKLPVERKEGRVWF